MRNIFKSNLKLKIVRDIQIIWINLARSQEIIDIWLKVQKYMQQQHQIFIYEDIRKQLSMEYSRYESVEKTWKSNMDVKKNFKQFLANSNFAFC